MIKITPNGTPKIPIKQTTEQARANAALLI